MIWTLYETHCRPVKWDYKPVLRRDEKPTCDRRDVCVSDVNMFLSVNSDYHLLTGDVGEYAFVGSREQKYMLSCCRS